MSHYSLQLKLILKLSYRELSKIVGQSSFDPKSLCHFRPKHKSAPPPPPSPPVKTNKVKQLDLSWPRGLPAAQSPGNTGFYNSVGAIDKI